MSKSRTEAYVDVALVGGGIVSATLANLLTELMPGLSIQVFERLGAVAAESSQGMNNAGTGHAAYCELNYTPKKADGSVDISKALKIYEAFEVSLQFWSRLVEKGVLPNPRAFMNPVPHLSFVWGEDNVRFLRTRQALLSAHPMFSDMQITEDQGRLAEWMPLVMQDRQAGEPLAATRVDRGTDIDFGVLTRLLFEGLAGRADFQLHLNHQVKRLRRDSDGMWRLTVKDRVAGESRQLRARFVFLGAGGGALPLLQSSGIPEAKGYAGFPVSGQWLVCKDPAVVERHMAKVYGLAAVGAPPMSVPHLDTRFTNGSRALLFGPYAGFSTKYLKEGSFWDLPGSLRFNNLWPMLAVARDNMDLTRYLIGEVLQSEEARMRTLQTFMPTARIQDWKLEVAGQRVQIIKRDQNRGGRLEFGTEVVASADGTLGALLGASPGASTAAATMLEVIRRCSGATPGAEEFARSLRLLIPSYGRSLAAEPDLLRTVRDRTNKVMGLNA